MAVSQPTQNEQQPLAEAQPAPQEPTKVSPAEFEQMMKDGKVDLSGNPDELIAKYVDFGEQQDAEKHQAETPPSAEQPKAEPPQKQEQPPAEQPKKEPEERVRFKTFGEYLKTLSEKSGESYVDLQDAMDKYLNKKEHLGKLQTAVDTWKRDAITYRTQVEQMKAELEKSKKAPPAPQQPAAPQPKAEQSKDLEFDEPEIPEPDEFENDPAKLREYYKKVTDRNNRIQERRLKAKLEEMTSATKAEIQAVKNEINAEKERLRKENEERMLKEASARRQHDTFNAASDFIGKRKEFEFGDGLSVVQKTEEWGEWLNTLNHIQSTNPQLRGRNLVQEYLSGNPNTVGILDQYGIKPPSGAKQYAVLLELERICLDHKLYKDTQYDSKGNMLSGRPDFEAAYAIKKNRDGADLEELQQAYARGSENVLNAVQERNAAPPEIGAHEISQVKENEKQTPEMLNQALMDLQNKMSTMTPEQVQQAHNKIMEQFASVGIKLDERQ